MKRTINIGFEGFWKVFDPEDNFITNTLRRHYDVRISKKPDYLFYSVFNDKFINYDCVKIFFTGENLTPDFNLCDYAIGYDHISFGKRYLRYPLWLLYNPYFSKDEKGRTTIERMNEKKEGFCTFVYSNPKADKTREDFFHALSEYKRVDSGGKLHNNIGGRVEDKRQFEASHKFSIAFENVSQAGYSTEKILGAFAAGSVPIYWGDREIEKVFNKEAFINCNGCTIEEMVELVRQVDQDDALYEKMRTAPIFCEPDYIDQKEWELEAFLLNIVETPYEEAFQNASLYWKARYKRRLRLGLVVNSILEAFIK